MKTQFLLLLFYLVLLMTSYGQDEKRNHFGINLSFSASNQFTYLEYERFVGKHASISPRIGFYKYKMEYEDGYVETGEGPGIGFSFRWHFGKKPAEGFFVGAGMDTYADLIFIPQFQAGYHIPLGKSMYLQPILSFGKLFTLDSVNDEMDKVPGFFRGGFTFGFRF